LRLRSDEVGTELVEFAFVLPGLMIVLTGTMSFALALYSLQQLGNATANAVQVVAAEAGLITDPCAQAVTSVTATLPKWTAGKFTYTMVITDQSNATHTYGPTTGSTFSCTAGAAEEAQNYPIVLTVKYAYSWLPVLKFTPSSPLTSTQGTIAD
jgi:Flp pilus assembly protein TadG